MARNSVKSTPNQTVVFIGAGPGDALDALDEQQETPRALVREPGPAVARSS